MDNYLQSGMHDDRLVQNRYSLAYPSLSTDSQEGTDLFSLESHSSGKEGSKSQSPSQVKTASSRLTWNIHSSHGDLVVDEKKVKHILDIIIDIISNPNRFDIDMVNSCLAFDKHKSAIAELDKLRRAFQSIWSLLVTGATLNDSQKEKYLPQAKTSLQSALEEVIKEEPAELDHSDTFGDGSMQSQGSDCDDLTEGLSEENVTLSNRESSNILGGDGNSLSLISDNFSTSEYSECTYLHKLKRNSGNASDKLEFAADDARMNTSNSAEQDIVNKWTLGRSQAPNSMGDGQTQSSRKDGGVGGDCVVIEDETNIPSTSQDSEETSKGSASHIGDKTKRSLATDRKDIPKCSAIGCDNTIANRSDLVFFRFPLDMMRCVKWIINSRRIDLVGKSSEFLHQNHFFCSLHFEKELLSIGSEYEQFVPSVFSFPTDSQQPMPFLKIEDIPSTSLNTPTAVQETLTTSQETAMTAKSPNLSLVSLLKAPARQKRQIKECSAIGCDNTQANRPDLGFFRFPIDAMRCIKWVVNCQRVDLVGKSSEFLNQNHFFCSLHFEQEQLSDGSGVDQLVPTIFSFPADPTADFDPASFLKEDVLADDSEKPKKRGRKRKAPHTSKKGKTTGLSGPRQGLSSKLSRKKPARKTPRTEKVKSASSMPCDQCDMVCTSIRDLKRHRKKIHGEGDEIAKATRPVYKCDLCDLSFPKKKLLKEHKIVTHNSDESASARRKRQAQGRSEYHMCDLCGIWVKQIQGHIKMHEEYKAGVLHPCEVCKKQFKLKSQLRHHMVKHGRRKHQCAMCGKCFFLKSSLANHMRSHTGEKPYKCEVCSRGFATKPNLVRHSLTHTGEKPHQCEFCDKSFASSTTLKAHQRMLHTQEKPFKCTLCNSAFISSTLLLIHRFTIHGVNDPNSNGQKPYECPKCGLKIALKICLNHHLKFQCGDEAYLPKSRGRSNLIPCYCPICNETFDKFTQLNGHMVAIHSISENQCHVCGKRVKFGNLLRHHREVHQGYKPHECTVCGRCFTQKQILEQHMWTHRPDKQFKCELCGSGYSDKRNLASHLKKIHNCTLEPPKTQRKKEAALNFDCVS